MAPVCYAQCLMASGPVNCHTRTLKGTKRANRSTGAACTLPLYLDSPCTSMPHHIYLRDCTSQQPAPKADQHPWCGIGLLQQSPPAPMPARSPNHIAKPRHLASRINPLSCPPWLLRSFHLKQCTHSRAAGSRQVATRHHVLYISYISKPASPLSEEPDAAQKSVAHEAASHNLRFT